MDDLNLAIMFLFACMFAVAAWSATRTRETLARDITLAFSGLGLLFVSELVRRATGSTFTPLAIVGAILLLAQPIFTLRVANTVRGIPRWVIPISAAGLGLSTAIALIFGKVVEPGAAIVLLATYAGSEGAAALYLALEARRRRGSARARLALAAIATGAFAVAIALVTGTGFGPDSAVTVAANVGIRAMALLAGVGYLVAFLPPARIRRLWQATAAFRFAEELLDAPPGESAEALWARLAEASVTITGDHSAVVVLGDDGTSSIVAAAAGPGETAVSPSDKATYPAGLLEALIASPGRRRDTDVDPIRADIARRTGARYTFVVPVTRSARRPAILVIGSERAGLFGEDDRALLEVIGAETGLLVERREMLAQQEDLADRLAETVTALRSASAAKSDFLASMSHELRTPLNAIIGFSDLMRAESSTDSDVTVPLEWVEHVHRGGQHLLALVNDVLDLAKVEAGRIELARETIDLASAVGESIAGLRPLADRKGLTLEAHLEPGAALADRGRLRQILYNLLSNAIKFTPAGGRITVECDSRDGMTRLAVIDTGVGIALEDQAAVFTEFRQVGDVSARAAGTGLGLALTRRLVEAHGGSISLESRLGEGSRFTVLLPGAETAGASASERASVPVAGRVHGTPRDDVQGLDVLIIEDDPGAVRLLREYLDAEGYRLRIAVDGTAGLAEARRRRPAAIILDVLLPG
ncbi:MAG TPA: ATP-binding protein, partial [Candidatus Acidoferrum sp.]|nr:ATP-binding protein [Candidatus Acidoferrum sp.]